jgi:hypothetical protein
MALCIRTLLRVSAAVAQVSLAVFTLGGAGWAADPQLEKVFSDWKKRQEQCTSVRYQVTGETIISKGSWHTRQLGYDPAVPPEDTRSPVSRNILVDFSGSRYRFELEEQLYDKDTQRLYPNCSTRVFDGKAIKTYRPRELNTHPKRGLKPTDPELGIGTGAKEFPGAAVFIEHWPIFFAHGCICSRDTRIVPGKDFKVLPDIDTVYVHGRAAYQGRDCLIIRNHRISNCNDEWWVDVDRESAVVRYFWVVEPPYPDTEIEMDYKRTTEGSALKGWTKTKRDHSSGKVLTVERMRVQSVEFSVANGASDFQIEQKPGILVAYVNHRPSTAESFMPEPESTKLYRVDESGATHEVQFENGVERRVRSITSWWWLLAVMMSLLVGAVVLHLWYRRWRQAA